MFVDEKWYLLAFDSTACHSIRNGTQGNLCSRRRKRKPTSKKNESRRKCIV